MHFYGNRGEMGCPSNPSNKCPSGRQDCPACNTRFLSLEGENTTLNNFNLETYGDGDAVHNMVCVCVCVCVRVCVSDSVLCQGVG